LAGYRFRRRGDPYSERDRPARPGRAAQDAAGDARSSSQHSRRRFMFASVVGTPLHRRNISPRALAPALKRAEIEPLRWHDLRHCFASLLIAGGANVAFVSRQCPDNSATPRRTSRRGSTRTYSTEPSRLSGPATCLRRRSVTQFAGTLERAAHMTKGSALAEDPLLRGQEVDPGRFRLCRYATKPGNYGSGRSRSPQLTTLVTMLG
jgi:hypothetical protein